MKKLTQYGIYAALTLGFGMLAGCSSSPKTEEVETPIAYSESAYNEPVVQDQTVSTNDSLNLGASSAGRAH